jgi:hypothetical protein
MDLISAASLYQLRKYQDGKWCVPRRGAQDFFKAFVSFKLSYVFTVHVEMQFCLLQLQKYGHP